MSRLIDLTGQRFGLLTVLNETRFSNNFVEKRVLFYA